MITIGRSVFSGSRQAFDIRQTFGYSANDIFKRYAIASVQQRATARNEIERGVHAKSAVTNTRTIFVQKGRHHRVQTAAIGEGLLHRDHGVTIFGQGSRQATDIDVVVEPENINDSDLAWEAIGDLKRLMNHNPGRRETDPASGTQLCVSFAYVNAFRTAIPNGHKHFAIQTNILWASHSRYRSGDGNGG
jgi:hypothetical protein